MNTPTKHQTFDEWWNSQPRPSDVNASTFKSLAEDAWNAALESEREEWEVAENRETVLPASEVTRNPCELPADPTEAGEGYQLLDAGEIIQAGDEFSSKSPFPKDGWTPVMGDRLGIKVWGLSNFHIRRRITPAPAKEEVKKEQEKLPVDPGEGWRILQDGDIYKKGDECFSKCFEQDGRWEEITPWVIGTTVILQHDVPCRRRVQTDKHDSPAQSTPTNIKEVAEARMKAVLTDRERIMEAFIAKYAITDPAQAEQVQCADGSWHVRLKPSAQTTPSVDVGRNGALKFAEEVVASLTAERNDLCNLIELLMNAASRQDVVVVNLMKERAALRAALDRANATQDQTEADKERAVKYPAEHRVVLESHARKMAAPAVECSDLLSAFVGFPKISRLSRECWITEKIDGTNGQICITEDGQMLVGSRTRWITSEQDNYGFARWAMEHREELMTLGVGRHFGEWWGGGCQRGYGLPKGEKRWSLFNVSRWCLAGETPQRIPTADPRIVKMQDVLPACCHLVPVLYHGIFTTEACSTALERLRTLGSEAAPGFMNPEGIICYHVTANTGFKKTLEKDDVPKALQAHNMK